MLSDNTVEIRTDVLQEFAVAYSQGSETVQETVNLLEAMVNILTNPDEIDAEERENVIRTCNQSVIPLLQNVRLRFNLLGRQAEDRANNVEEKTPELRFGVIIPALNNGEETVQQTISVLEGICEGIDNGELTGDDAAAVADNCKGVHVPTLQNIVTEFSTLQEELNAVENTSSIDSTFKQRIANAFSVANDGVKAVAALFEDMANKLTNGELKGEDAEPLAQMIQSPLLPALAAVGDRLKSLNEQVAATA